MPRHTLRRHQVLARVVIIVDHGAAEVVGLNCLFVLREEASEPLAQDVASGGGTPGCEHHRIVRRALLLPVSLHRLLHRGAVNHPPLCALLRNELDLDEAIFVRDGLRDLSERYAYNILDTEGTLVQ